MEDAVPATHTHRAKKSLGQHFLRSPKALAQIVQAANITPGEVVLEIGPGQGVLTQALLAAGAQVIAIEKDTDLIPLLQETFAEALTKQGAGSLTLLHKDILQYEPEALQVLAPQGYKLVANIPYYITGAIIEQFLNTPFQPKTMVLLLQKEVAERMIAKPGIKQGKNGANNKGSILSIAIQSYGTVRIVGVVPPGAFSPMPTVDSAIIAIEGISRDFFADCDEKQFLLLVKTLFGQKRRQIGGTLGAFIGDSAKAQELLRSVSIDPRTRAEELTLEQWKEIAKKVTQS